MIGEFLVLSNYVETMSGPIDCFCASVQCAVITSTLVNAVMRNDASLMLNVCLFDANAKKKQILESTYSQLYIAKLRT